MENYKERLIELHGTSIWNLAKSKSMFSDNMNNKKSLLFHYLIEKLEKNEILYRFGDSFYIPLKTIHYFYFEMQDDLSYEYTDKTNLTTTSIFNSKKDVDKFIEVISC